MLESDHEYFALTNDVLTWARRSGSAVFCASVERKGTRMASRALPNRQLFGEINRTFILFVWAAFACSVFFYFSDWPLRSRDIVTPPQANLVDTNDDAIRYTGSIVLSEPRGDRCWVRMLDNRTGSMWDRGFLNCDDVISALAKNDRPSAVSIVRMNSISQAFRRNGN